MSRSEVYNLIRSLGFCHRNIGREGKRMREGDKEKERRKKGRKEGSL